MLLNQSAEAPALTFAVSVTGVVPQVEGEAGDIDVRVGDNIFTVIGLPDVVVGPLEHVTEILYCFVAESAGVVYDKVEAPEPPTAATHVEPLNSSQAYVIPGAEDTPVTERTVDCPEQIEGFAGFVPAEGFQEEADHEA